MPSKYLTPEQRAAKARRRAEKRAQEHAERREANIAALCSLHPGLEVLTYPELLVHSSDFVRNVAHQFRETGRLSPRQVETVLRAVANEHAQVHARAAHADEVGRG